MVYESTSSQQINRGKTTLFFSKAMAKEKKGEIFNFLGVPKIKEYEKYLGLPTVVGRRNKKANLNYIKELVWNNLFGINYRDRRKNYYLKQEEKSCQKWLFRLFQLSL